MRHLSLVLCLLLGVASAQAPDEKPQGLASIVPANTLVMVEAEDLGGMAQWMRDTALGRIWAEPEVQSFAMGLEKSFMDSMERMQGGFNPLAMVGLDVKDFVGIEVHRAGFALIDFEFSGFMPQFDLVLTAQFRAGAEKGEKIVNALRQAVQTFTGLPFEEVTLQGKKIWRANPMGYEICLFMEADRFLLTTKTERMDQILAALRDGLPQSLAANPRFGNIVQRMGAHRRALFAYADIKGVHEKGVAVARTMIEQQALPERNLVQFEGYWKGLGLDAVEAVAFADIPQGTGFRTEAAVTFTERRGLLSVIPAGRVNHRFAKHAPEGALLYAAENVDLGAYLKGWVDLIASFEPRAQAQVQKFLGEFRIHLGVDLKTDILDALGSDWAAYVGAPPEGGLVPDLAVFITVKDRAKLEKSLDTVVQRLAGMAAEERVYARLGETHFRGLKIRYLEMAERKDPIPVVPSWAFVDDYMVFALVPQTIKHAMMEKRSLAESEDFRSLLRSIPQESMNASWILQHRRAHRAGPAGRGQSRAGQVRRDHQPGGPPAGGGHHAPSGRDDELHLGGGGLHPFRLRLALRRACPSGGRSQRRCDGGHDTHARCRPPRHAGQRPRGCGREAAGGAAQGGGRKGTAQEQARHGARQVRGADLSHRSAAGRASKTHRGERRPVNADFRSDTVTRPTSAMRRAMAE
ncbi:MAG: hypothetical protein ACYSX0_16065, partial [Planctomycetota bacterium]